MDLRKIKKLIELLEESNINEIEIKEGEESVRISRNGVQTVAMAAPVAPVYAAPAAPMQAAHAAPVPAPAATISMTTQRCTKTSSSGTPARAPIRTSPCWRSPR